MARLRSNQTPAAGPWPQGINNRAAQGELPRDEFGTKPVALREAENVDLSTSGSARRRQGYTDAIHSGENIHSLWSHDELSFGLFVDAGVLHALRADGTVRALPFTPGDFPLSYSLIEDRVYASNRFESALLLHDGDADTITVHPWGAPATPAVPEVHRVTSGGSLFGGSYQVSVTHVDELGRESGATYSPLVYVEDGDSILVTLNPSDHHRRVYVSTHNDQVPRLVAERGPDSAVHALVVTTAGTGVALATRNMEPMPAGQYNRIFNGRHWVADGRYLRWSQPFFYGMTDPGYNLIRFDSEFDLMEPVGRGDNAGIFVATAKRTYWIAGGTPDAMSPVDAAPYGAVPGTALWVRGSAIGMDDDDDRLIWLGRRGNYVLGADNGRITPVNAATLVMHNADHGASVVVSRDGVERLITTLKNPRAASGSLAVGDFASAVVVHRDR